MAFTAPVITESTLDVSGFMHPTVWEFLGLPYAWGRFIEHVLSYRTLADGLQLINIVSTMIVAASILFLLVLLRKIFSYVVKEKFIDVLRLTPAIVDRNQYEFFSTYCRKDANGTFLCSYDKHKRYQRFVRWGFHGLLYSSATKIAVVAVLFFLNITYLQAFEGRSGTNYSIFIDALVGGGSLSSPTYSMDSSLGEPVSGDTVTSPTYESDSGFTELASSGGAMQFTVNTTPIHFGVVTNQATAYQTHTFTAAYEGIGGYDIVINGVLPTSDAGSDIDAMGPSASAPTIGVEQIGINLAGNTIPAIVGGEPVGGSGVAVAPYNTTNQYALRFGDVVARSTISSIETAYTVTVIMNISDTTPAGAYAGELRYTMVPKY